MRVRHLFLMIAFAPMPLSAQPPAAPPGPWTADADRDGAITRAEMTAWIEQQFGGMDSDGDGRVTVQAIRQIMGHERRDADRGAQEGERQHGEGQAGERPGRGPGGGGPRGAGGPPPGGPPRDGRRPDGAQARGDGPPPPRPGAAMPWPEDGNDDGMIDRAEFAAPMLTMFADQDRNSDGVLTADELPHPPAPPGEGD